MRLTKIHRQQSNQLLAGVPGLCGRPLNTWMYSPIAWMHLCLTHRPGMAAFGFGKILRLIPVITIFCASLIPSIGIAKSFTVSRWQTSNGAQVVFRHAPEIPILDISIAFAAGSAYDGEEHGLSALTVNMMDEGNKGLDAKPIAEKLAAAGAQYTADTSRDMAVFSLKSLTEPSALKKSFDAFTLIINHPDFPEKAFLREKNQQLQALVQAEESPDEVANKTFFKLLYQNHPYAHPINGDEKHVQALTVADVREFYRQFFVSNNAVIVLVGAIDEQTAHKLAEELVGNLPTGDAADRVPTALPIAEELNVAVKFPSAQTAIRLGQLGITHKDPDYFPLIVGNYVLGGGILVSRLANEIREKRGLSYGVHSQFLPLPGIGPFIISLSTKNDQAENAVDIARQMLEDFIKTGPSPQELTSAKNHLVGSFPLALAGNRRIANMLLKIAFYNLPDDYLDTYTDKINAVSELQIKQALQKLIDPDKLLQVSVGQDLRKTQGQGKI